MRLDRGCPCLGLLVGVLFFLSTLAHGMTPRFFRLSAPPATARLDEFCPGYGFFDLETQTPQSHSPPASTPPAAQPISPRTRTPASSRPVAPSAHVKCTRTQMVLSTVVGVLGLVGLLILYLDSNHLLQ